jgi:hypothetical protein
MAKKKVTKKKVKEEVKVDLDVEASDIPKPVVEEKPISQPKAESKNGWIPVTIDELNQFQKEGRLVGYMTVGSGADMLHYIKINQGGI